MSTRAVKRAFYVGIFILLWPLVVYATKEKLTIADWPHLTEQRKLYYIFASMQELQDEGQIFNHSAYDYISILDQSIQLRKDKSTDMQQVFAETVRQKENDQPKND